MNHAVHEFKALTTKKNSSEALQLLKRIASQVMPIMRKRGWKVQHLCEFYPKNPNLLGVNVNRGYKINIRLRPHHNDTVFLDYNDLLGTMLHELVHIVRGPHDATFYKILDELNEELDALILTGQTGYAAFDGVGNRLGGLHAGTPLDAKRRALAAAERRRQTQRIMLPSGGVRLGGTRPVEKNLSPAQMAARAADRRLQDQKWCGGLEEADPSGSSSSSSNEGAPTVIVLDDDDNGENTPASGGRKRRYNDDKDDGGTGARAPAKRPHTTWICAICTFENQGLVLVCGVCLSQRPATDNNSTSWSCPQCTLSNQDTRTCDACGYNKV